jgi:hypothetical protein
MGLYGSGREGGFLWLSVCLFGISSYGGFIVLRAVFLEGCVFFFFLLWGGKRGEGFFSFSFFLGVFGVGWGLVWFGLVGPIGFVCQYGPSLLGIACLVRLHEDFVCCCWLGFVLFFW